MVLRAIDDKKAIQAHRSQAGHQPLPLTEDLYKDAVACTKRVPSLREFIADSYQQLLPQTPPEVERKGRGSVQVTGVESRDSTGVQSFGDSVFLGKTSNCQHNNTEQHDHSHQHDSSSMDPHRNRSEQVADGLDHLGTSQSHAQPSHQGRDDRCSRIPGRDSTVIMDHGGIEVPARRAERGAGHSFEKGSKQDRAAALDHCSQQSQWQEVSTPGILPGTSGTDHHGIRDHGCTEASSPGKDLLPGNSPRHRWSGIWSPCQSDLRGDQAAGARLLPMGLDHSPRREVIIPSQPIGSMVENGDGGGDKDEAAAKSSGQEVHGQPCKEQGRQQPQRHFGSQQHADGNDESDDVNTDCPQGRSGTDARRETTQEGCQWEELPGPGGCRSMILRTSMARSPMGTKTSSNEPSRPEVPVSDLAQSLVVPTSVKTLTESAARYLEKQSLDIVPQAFQSLVKKSKTTLIEVACSPESRLSSEVQKLLGDSHAAVRCSHWNGCDLGESNGVKRILETIDMNQPEHVWISPECGPYSPMQAIDQRTAAQTEELQNKRRIALKQYIGASCVFQYCFQKGIHVTWEWSQYCQGWQLPFMQRLIAKCNPYFGVTHGCRVGMRDPKSHTLVKKGWKLMSTSRRLTEAMNLPCICPKTYQHARCEGGLAGLTAYYTPEFVHKVAQLVIQEMSHDMVHEELKGSTVLPKTFGEGTSCVCGSLKEHGCSFSCGHCHQQNSVKVFECEHEKHENKHDGCFGCHHGGQKHVQDEAFVQQFVSGMSSAEIQRKLYLLHAATGHGSVRNMVRALERRQAPKEVLDAARQFQCSVCKEKQRVNFKHTASLEPLPAKFAVVAADGGKWTHPITQEEYEFACIIDEGSRYRVARILKQGKKQTMNAAQFTQYFREGWMQYFGCPNTLRLDPAGCFRSHQLERFCDDHSIFLDVIPGEAHWMIGICEQAISGLKTLMTKLTSADPEISAEEALAESVRVFNQREIGRGYSPIQHVLGRAPDATGRFVSSFQPDNISETFLENPNGEFQRNIERMRLAETALVDWQAQQRLKRAMNSKAQRVMDYRPGDLVYYWRKQISGEPANKNGRFFGVQLGYWQRKPRGRKTVL